MSVDFPETFNIADYFLGDRIREGMGDRRALLTDEGPVTYAELDELSNRFGNLLLKGGVRPEERVIVSVPDSAEYVVALFGILKIGAVVVMVNPELKEDALRYFRDYTRATAAIVGEENAAIFRRAPAGAHRRCAVVRAGGGRGDLASRLRGSSPALETFPSHRDDAAIWLFSGGTTGRPKAVIQSHTSFANTTELYGKGTLEMGQEDITLFGTEALLRIRYREQPLLPLLGGGGPPRSFPNGAPWTPSSGASPSFGPRCSSMCPR